MIDLAQSSMLQSDRVIEASSRVAGSYGGSADGLQRESSSSVAASDQKDVLAKNMNLDVIKEIESVDASRSQDESMG